MDARTMLIVFMVVMSVLLIGSTYLTTSAAIAATKDDCGSYKTFATYASVLSGIASAIIVAVAFYYLYRSLPDIYESRAASAEVTAKQYRARASAARHGP